MAGNACTEIHDVATVAEQESQPCLSLDTSIASNESNKQGQELRSGAEARDVKVNLGSATLSVMTGLLPIYFLVFAGLAMKNNGIETDGHDEAQWLLQAANYVCTSDSLLR